MKQFLVLLFALVALSLMASGTFFTDENVNSFIDRLEEEGFIVQQGMFAGFDLLDLFANYMVPDCSGNNADNPYLVYYLPAAPSQEFENSLPFTFRLQEDEALVFLGWTPPEVAYFGYVTLIMFRYLPGQSTPVRIFASVGDTINITDIKAGESLYEKTAGTIFNAPTMILSTPDRNIDKTIRAIAEEVGFSQDIINTNPIPSALLKLGIKIRFRRVNLWRAVCFVQEPGRQGLRPGSPRGSRWEDRGRPSLLCEFQGLGTTSNPLRACRTRSIPCTQHDPQRYRRLL